MKKITIFLTLVCFLFACKTTQKTSTGQNSPDHDGSSFEKAILIEEKNESSGIAAEYEWLRKNYPNCQKNGQSLVYHSNKPFDIIEIKTAEGKKMSVYFDISNFFGKF